MAILEAARLVNPPEWLIGAGVIRDVVWDRLHEYTTPTPHRDIDVGFFDPFDLSPARDLEVEAELCYRYPGVPWDAKNQAAVHLWYERRFGRPAEPFHSAQEAVATFPETAVCVGVRLLPDGTLCVVAPHAIDDLFGIVLRRNPSRVTVEEYGLRVRDKRLLKRWPLVRFVDG